MRWLSAHNDQQKRRLRLIAVSILLLAVVALGSVTAWQAMLIGQDKRTVGQAQTVANKLNDYVYEKRTLPESLQAAGIKQVPDSVSYRKLSPATYKFCVTFKAASNNDVFDMYYGGSFYDGSFEDQAKDPPDAIYIDSYRHHKGSNCLTVKPYLNNEPLQSSSSDTPSSGISTVTDPKQQAIASAGQDNVCNLSGFGTRYSGTVASVGTADGKPIVPTTNQAIVVTVKPDGNSPAGTQTLTLARPNDIFNVFDSVCTAHTYESFKVGDAVSVFLDNSNQYMPDAIVNFSYGR